MKAPVTLNQEELKHKYTGVFYEDCYIGQGPIFFGLK